MNTDANAALRAAVRRLMQAVRRDGIEVVVLRQDIDLLLALVSARLEEPAQPGDRPTFHPAQR